MSDDLSAKWAQLREDFKPNQISKLPKPFKADSPKGKCQECGGFHGLPAMHLDYVGHAALTDRLLDVDPLWTWEPLALTPEGLPLIDKDGGLWIKLTICGHTRLGYGDAGGKTGSNAMKERIGDALRNAGMRFGLALDLWHKGDLHADTEAANQSERKTEPDPDTQRFDACKAKRDAHLKPGEKANIWSVLGALVGCDTEAARVEPETRSKVFAEAVAKTDEEWSIAVDSVVRGAREEAQSVSDPNSGLDMPAAEPLDEKASKQTVGAMSR